jgi:HEPN domain-containing protein
LGDQAAHYEPGFTERVERWGIVDTYYVPTRYPNGLPDDIPARVYRQSTATNAVVMAEEAVDYVSSLLETVESG